MDKKVFSPAKLAVNHHRLEAYARGEHFFPVTMEIDLTQKCTRDCPSCPYGATRSPGLTLSFSFLERLFGILGPQVPGLVLSGGEPTSVPYFPEILALARRSGFEEISVISNGSLLHEPRIQDALLEHASSVRVSLYDWQEGEAPYFVQTLKNIEELRKKADFMGSPLEIAAGMLTQVPWLERIAPVAGAALDAGLHWIYFHPFCLDWETDFPFQAPQDGVIETIESFKVANGHSGEIHIPYERYQRDVLEFVKLHAAHFLIQVGADGINYAGPECKYEKDYALLDLNEYLKDDFLWHPKRLARIEKIHSANYRPIGTRHRPPIISAFVQAFLDDPASVSKDRPHSFHQPHVI